MEGYTYLNHLINNPDLQKFVGGIAIGGVLLGLGVRAASRIKQPESLQDAIIPPKGFSLSAVFDFFIEAFIKYYDSILGKERREFLPFCASVFFFVLTTNLLGLVPGMPAPTTTVWVNVGMALVVFVSFNWIGVKEQGLFGYLKHFCGGLHYWPMILVGIIVFVLEILSNCIRILTLNMRLYWNISADHIVLGIFTDLTKFVVPIVFYAMGTFVCFMQAFVFSTLTMIYILFVLHHEEEDHH
ncbi:MAG: F0F1 ATP synthase subunit A [SAR324 cluster bacterium]|uniref:ATP synthase subunit a n=1 Tax=SAR324 cluster bacterium TaxID=2024889 RepID=A0A7X9FUP4_9DELT|nr:F0F1 ATP synthase subunit A [SAR324 cluster bacterium]